MVAKESQKPADEAAEQSAEAVASAAASSEAAPAAADAAASVAEDPVVVKSGDAGPDAKDADPSIRKAKVEKITRNHVIAATGIGLLPVPVLDVVGVIGVQLDLIRVLSRTYGVEFDQKRSRAIVMSLLSGILPAATSGVLASMLKLVPVIGTAAAAVTLPVLSGAVTYAVAGVFSRHFDAGGTIETLDASKAKGLFLELFDKGKTVAAEVEKDKAGADTSTSAESVAAAG